MKAGAVAVALLALVGCARRTDFIGRVLGDAGGSGDIRDAVPGTPDSGAAGVICPAADPTLPVVPAPVWSCGDRCIDESTVGPAMFGSAAADPDPRNKAAILYPEPGSVHPLNLARITVQWRRGSANQTAFRIRVDPGAGQPPYDLHVPYARPVGAAGTIIDALDATVEIGPPVWRYIARQHAGAEVSLTVAGHDSATNQVAVSDPVTIRFSPAALQAALYYLAATESPGSGIQRHVFGTGGARAVVRPGSEANAHDCGGCHSISRDGRTLAFAATYAGNLTVAPTHDPEHPTMRPPPPPMDVANGLAPAVSPDGKHIVARHGVSDTLFVYDDGGRLVSQRTVAETDGRIDFPEFSPDGREIVATRARPGSQPPKKYSAYDGHLVVLPFSGGVIGQADPILFDPASIQAHPSWSPDGQWIVFTSAPVGGESHGNRQTRLRLVHRQDRRVFDLNHATGDGLGAFSPKFAPTGQNDCQIFFIAFHSRRNYGLLRRNDSAALGGTPQLWLSAIDLGRAGDPSSPPVWLPFQDINQQNLLPVWSEQLPCTADDGCGEGAACQSGRCVARPY
jgi:hypothetical protein